MNRDDIIRMAREAGANLGAEAYVMHERCFERFAALVADAEREACAKVCDEIAQAKTYQTGYLQETAEECVDAIRARGEQK